MISRNHLLYVYNFQSIFYEKIVNTGLTFGGPSSNIHKNERIGQIDHILFQAVSMRQKLDSHSYFFNHHPPFWKYIYESLCYLS